MRNALFVLGLVAFFVLVAVVTVLALGELPPSSLPSTYRAKVAAVAVDDAATDRVVTEADIAPLPPSVQRWMRSAGVVGRPRVESVHVKWSGAMKGSVDGPWMKMRAEQVNVFASGQRVRYFFMRSSMYGVPFQALHVYQGASATMNVRVAGVVGVVDARGPEMDASETVTMLNDMCVLAPSSLLSADVWWEELDAHSARVTFANAGHVVHADLFFDDAGDLVDFVSRDRLQTADGKAFHSYVWSTPLSAYEVFDGGRRVPTKGEARWAMPEGPLVYGRFVVDAIDFNAVPARAESLAAP